MSQQEVNLSGTRNSGFGDVGSHQKISDLQVLRGIAILMVLLQHMSLTPTLLSRLPTKFNMPFYIGVEIFFVISGYIITKILMRDGYDARRFLLKRAFRLLPPIFVFLGLTAIINILYHTLPVPAHATETFAVSTSTFFRQAVAIVGGYYILINESCYMNGAMWSLAVEDMFYLTIAAVMGVAGAVLRWKKDSVERLVGGLACLVFFGILAIRFGILSRSVSLYDLPKPVIILTAWKFDFIAAGIVLSFLDRRLRDYVRAKFAESGPMLCAFSICGMMGLIAVCESPFAADKRYLDGFGMPMVCLGSCIITILAGNGVAFPRTRGRLQRSLEYLGDRSYTYYLLHYPMFAVTWLLCLFTMPWAFHGAKAYGTMQLLVTAALLIPLAEFVYQRIEKPWIKRGRLLVDRWFPISKFEQATIAQATVALDPNELSAMIPGGRWSESEGGSSEAGPAVPRPHVAIAKQRVS